MCLTEFDEKKFVRTMKADGYKKGRADGADEGLTQGHASGVAQTKLEIAKAMLREGLSCDLVAKCTGLSTDEISVLIGQ